MTASRSGARRPLVRSLDNLEALELASPRALVARRFRPTARAWRSFGRVASWRRSRSATPSGQQSSTAPTRAGYWSGARRESSIRPTARFAWCTADRQQPRSLTTLEAARGEVLHGEAVTLPGGRVVLFSVQTRDASGDRIEAVEVATGARSVVVDRASTPVWSATGHLLFERDGALFAAAFDALDGARDGARGLRAAGRSRPRHGRPGGQLSPQRHARLCAARVRSHAAVWQWPGMDQLSTSSCPLGLQRSARLAGPAACRRDQGHREMLVVDLNRGSATRLGPPAYGVSYGIWSGDGLRAVFRLFSIPVSAAADGSGKVSPVPSTVSNDYPRPPVRMPTPCSSHESSPGSRGTSI